MEGMEGGAADSAAVSAGVGAADQNINQNGMTADWRANFPPELQTAAAKFSSAEELMKAYMGAQSLIGRKVDDFKREHWDSYVAMMSDVTGIPPTADGYNVQIAQPEQQFVTETDMGMLRGIAHDLGLNQRQMQGLYDAYNNYAAEVYNQTLQYVYNGLNTLSQKWGNAAETKMNAVSAAVNNVLPKLMGVSPEVFKEKISEALADPFWVDLLSKVGELGTESVGRGYNNLTPTDARLRLQQMKSDPNIRKILMNKLDPQYEAVHGEFQRLLALKYR